MSKFSGGVVFIVISETDVTNEIINRSNSIAKENAPTKVVDDVTKLILEFEEDKVPDCLINYSWYSKEMIHAAWESL